MTRNPKAPRPRDPISQPIRPGSPLHRLLELIAQRIAERERIDTAEKSRFTKARPDQPPLHGSRSL
jgi:hypothetical protein